MKITHPINQITDEWTSKVSEVLNLLQKRIEEEKECRQLEIKDFHGVIDGLLKQFQVRIGCKELND